MKSRRLRAVLVAFAGIAGVALAIAARLMLAGSRNLHPNEADIADFMGDEACRRCHVKQFAEAHASDHAKALMPMTREALGASCPNPGRINDSQYALVEKAGVFYFEVNVPSMPDKYQLWPIDFVFGSGHSGISFVSMLEGRNVVEMKMSYFPHERKWMLTPGQKLENPAAAGNIGNLQQSRRCIGCHAVAMSKNTYVPRREFYGVGCESCHGPGRAHLEAVEARQRDHKMVRLKSIGAKELNTLCGKCHQTAKDVENAGAMAKMTYRFQPYGLMKSRCFLESGDRLSCMTCHDAHAQLSTDPAHYDKACLGCHAQGAITVGAGNGATATKPCPTKATSDCIRCHMPRRDVLSAYGQTSGKLMSEHRIGIYRDVPPRRAMSSGGI